MFANVTDKIKESEVLHPIVIIEHRSGIGGSGIKVNKTRQLRLNACHIGLNGFLVEQIAFLRLAAGVANHTRGATNNENRFVPCQLEMLHHHDRHEMPHVKGICRRVNAHVEGRLPFLQKFFSSRHDILEHASPFQFFNKIHIVVFFKFQINWFAGKHASLSPFFGKRLRGARSII